MNTTRPKSLTWIAIFLVVIALISAVTPFLNLVRVGAAGQQNFPGGGNFQPGQVPPGDRPFGGGPGGDFQSGQGGGNFQPGQGRSIQGQRGGLALFGLIGNLGINFQIIGYITSGITILGVLLTVLAAYGVWKQKRWGLNLAFALSLFFVLGALPALFFGGGRTFLVFNAIGIVRTVLSYVKPLAALPVLVLSILPSTRDFTS